MRVRVLDELQLEAKGGVDRILFRIGAEILQACERRAAVPRRRDRPTLEARLRE